MLVNQGLLGIAFFEATAFIILLVLFFIFQRDHINRYFRLWVAGWIVLHPGIALRGSDAEPQFAAIVDVGGDGKSGGDAAVFRRRGAIYDRGREARLADFAARGRGVIRGLLLPAQRDAGLCKRGMGNGAAGERRMPVGRDGAVEVAVVEARARRAIAGGRVFTDRHPRIGPSAVAAASLLFVASGV